MTATACPTCGHVKRAPRKVIADGFPFPAVVPAPGAEALHADHLARRDGSKRRGRAKVHPADKALRADRPDLVRFLRECAAAGRVARFYASDTPGMVRVSFAGERGVFHPCEPVELRLSEIEARSAQIADGSVWELYPRRLALVS